MGVRRLWALVRGLPRDCALHRDIDPDAASWGPHEELLASLIEVTDYGNRLFFSANTKKGTAAPPAVQINRPGQGPRRPPEAGGTPAPKMATPAEIRQFAGKHLKVVPKGGE